MSEHTLPEDLARWPEEPYDVLGVEPSADDRTIRRAYARLIKTFKPETHPEHFQRLRDAHDNARAMAEWQARWSAMHEAGDDEADPEGDEWSGTITFDGMGAPLRLRSQFDDEHDRSMASGPREDDFETEITAAWQVAIEGDLPLAYHALQSLSKQRHGHAGVAARLYWLLWIDGSLDDREPIAWLLEGLRETGPRGPLWELYKEAVTVHPVPTLDHELPTGPEGAVDSSRLVDLAYTRIEATAEHGSWERLRADLARLRDPILDGGTEQWVRIVGRALEHLSWSPERAGTLRLELDHEFASLAHVHLTADDAFDRHELLVETVDAVQRMRGDSELREVGRIVRDSWTGADRAERPLFETLAEWSRAPLAAVETLDRAMHPGWGLGDNGRIVLEQFRHLVEQRVRYDLVDTPPESVADAVRHRCRTWGRYSHESIRAEILDLCLVEWLTVDQLVHCCFGGDADLGAELQTFLHRLNGDTPLRIVTSGLRALSDAAQP